MAPEKPGVTEREEILKRFKSKCVAAAPAKGVIIARFIGKLITGLGEKQVLLIPRGRGKGLLKRNVGVKLRQTQVRADFRCSFF